jgi:hypothetical protein
MEGRGWDLANNADAVYRILTRSQLSLAVHRCDLPRMEARGKAHFERKSENTSVVVYTYKTFQSSIWGDAGGRRIKSSRPVSAMLVVRERQISVSSRLVSFTLLSCLFAFVFETGFLCTALSILQLTL